MKRTIFVAASLIPMCVWALDFKGIVIGAPTTIEQVREKLGVTCGVGANAMQVCNGSVSLAREPAELNLVINSSGVVQRIDLTLSPQAFDLIVPELIVKFGSPVKTDRAEIQNRMGAKFEQIQLFWQGEADTQLTYSKYAGSIARSRLYFSTKQDRELLEKQKENRAGDM